MDDLWFQLRFHVVILIFTVLQLNTYNLLKKKDARARDTPSSVSEIVQDGESHSLRLTYILDVALRAEAYNVDDAQQLRLVILARKLSIFFDTLTQKYTILACYLVFSLIGFTGDITIFDLGYLAIFCFCLCCYQLHSSRLIVWVWPAISLYSAVVASACYVYQFEEMHMFLIRVLGDSVVADIGLVATKGPGLFEYLVQPVVALFLSVFQYRIMTSEAHVPSLFGSGGLIADIFPSFVTRLIDFVKVLRCL